jgi:hypothetical protein
LNPNSIDSFLGDENIPPDEYFFNVNISYLKLVAIDTSNLKIKDCHEIESSPGQIKRDTYI